MISLDGNYLEYLLECKQRYNISQQEYIILNTILVLGSFNENVISQSLGIPEETIREDITNSLRKLFPVKYLEVTIEDLERQIKLLAHERKLTTKLA